MPARLLLWMMVAAMLLAPALAPGQPVPQDGDSPVRETTGPLFYPDDPVRVDPDDRHVTPKPRVREVHEILHGVKRSVSPPAADGSRIAMDINTLGRVPDSSWFTDRGRDEMSIRELVEGPEGAGPPASGRWKVVGHPEEGFTPKLIIEDPEGRRFLIKFGSEENPRMRSAAEVVCTKFFHAFGYNVPENYIAVFDPETLHVDPEVEPEDFPAQDVEQMLQDVPRTADGRVRVLASAWLPGEPAGPFLYEGTRPDDPNDIFPHQHRRSLRGMQVFASWLNHTDVKANNTLSMYVEEDGRSFLRHYLIDFGSCMGSGATGPKSRMTGYERYIDPGGILKGVFTFGLWSPPSVGVEYPDHPAVGNFEGDFYEPWRWEPPIPNAAFMNMDAADAFWAARIAAEFDDRAIAEIVSGGRYGDPEQEQYVVETLIERRDKTVAYWLTRTNPLDELRVEAGRLTWDNAAVRHELAAPTAAYDVRWFRLDNGTGDRSPVASEEGIDEGDVTASATIPDDPWGPEDRFGLRYAVAEIDTRHPEFPHWERPVVVTLRQGDAGAEIVGIRRPREIPAVPDG